MRARTCGALEGTAATGAIPAKSRMRSAPGLPIPGSFFNIFRALGSGPVNAERRSPSHSFLTHMAISLSRRARNSGTHAARFQSGSEDSRRCREQVFRSNAYVTLQLLPALGAGRIAGRVSTLPPNEELVGVDGPVRLLRTVEIL